MAKILIKNLKKKYDKNGPEIVRGVNMEIKDKDFVVVVGPSGCGKSTFLRMVAGLERANEGEIFIDDVLVNELEPKDRNIAMVFQNYALYPHMNVFKNIAYALKISGMPKQEIKERVEKTAHILKLTPFLDRKPNQLSGGQRQRVAMGRAIIREPKVFLFDEPLSNLDAKLRVQTRVEIKKLQRSLGITSIFVTHDQVEAMTLADTLVVMNQGRFEQVGTPIEIYQHPATLFVAGFIGSPPMNLIKGVLEKTNALRISPEIVMELEKPTAPQYLGKEIIAGIRAEHFRITPHAQGKIFLKIDVVEELGDEEILYGNLYDPKSGRDFQNLDKEGNPHSIYASFPIQDIAQAKKESLRVEPGEILPLTIESDQIHFFDPRSENRIAIG